MMSGLLLGFSHALNLLFTEYCRLCTTYHIVTYDILNTIYSFKSHLSSTPGLPARIEWLRIFRGVRKSWGLRQGSNVVHVWAAIIIPKKKTGHDQKGTSLEPLGFDISGALLRRLGLPSPAVFVAT